MSEIHTSVSDSAEETESDSLSLLRELISKPAPAPGTLTCPRCKSHVWKLRLEPNKDFFILECRRCLGELFVEFCDCDGGDE